MTDLSGLKQKMTPGGRQILEETVERKGEEWVEQNADLILAQAKKVGLRAE
jgi:hypothetical protein